MRRPRDREESPRPADSREPPPPEGSGRAAARSRRGIGTLAERLAACYLELRGFTVLDRNVRDGPREIDLVARGEGWIVIVEVRLRARLDWGAPEETVRHLKRQHLLRAGKAYWLRLSEPRPPLRFDLIGITLTGQGLALRHHPYFLNPQG